MAAYVTLEGRISFEPRTVGKSGVNGYSVGVYNGKDKDTKKATYMNFDVTDWNGVVKEKFDKGDFVSVKGDMTVAMYTGKDGSQKVSFRVTPSEMKKIPSPFENNGDNKQVSKPVANNDADDMPF